MDRSEAKAIVERHLEPLAESMGIGHWRLRVQYGPIEGGDAKTALYGTCRPLPEYERATIELDPEQFDDEAELLRTLRHELFHAVLGPLELLMRVAVYGLGGRHGQSVRSAATYAIEGVIRNLERLWFCVEHVRLSEGLPMPKGSKVDKVYQAIRKEGASKGKAAAIAQAKTGQSIVTGRKAKTHDGKPVPKRAKGKSKSK